jgi:hypothetical protein
MHTSNYTIFTGKEFGTCSGPMTALKKNVRPPWDNLSVKITAFQRGILVTSQLGNHGNNIYKKG